MNPKSSTTSLFDLAVKARENAHAPYSKFFVGAALAEDTDEKAERRVFTGCNFENASYGASICAERNAIGAMVNNGVRHFSEIVVVTDVENGTPPCGVCRQVLFEFAADPNKVMVHVATTKNIVRSYKLSELLPHAFDGSFLS